MGCFGCGMPMARSTSSATLEKLWSVLRILSRHVSRHMCTFIPKRIDVDEKYSRPYGI
ncbi:hypothetical protein CA13_52390 [Planctomycetes bacterium CA13]|uniref:Uncharacterized protein n=1 Tax=Novipirellula herctigrandis TaxID=2527986 RepID=A0A5C5Z967_9BACT|nr:hypothetical protein CA13_52390 [Planctomycetes bacterium CA13]